MITLATSIFADKEVLVMGLGRFGGGVDVVKFACLCGAKVTVTDLATDRHLKSSINQLAQCRNVEYHLGSHRQEDFEQADIVVVNPAVLSDNEFLEIARRCGKVVTSQIGIFFELCPARIIGVTGSNGKSTTAALTAHILTAGARQDDWLWANVWLSGNIGNEPLLMSLERIAADDLVVLELSSFQIEQLAQIQRAPEVALITNLLPNHLDRYGTFERYCAAKENIFKHQRRDQQEPAISIFDGDDKLCVKWFEKYSKQTGRKCLKFWADDVPQAIAERFTLVGKVNLSNLAGALAVAELFGVDDRTVEDCIGDFKALPHRLQLVAQIKGVKWYDDSKATTPESAIAAMEAFEQSAIIIAGGYDKHLAFDKLGETIAQRCKAALLIGQTAQKIKLAIEKAPSQRAKAKTRIEMCDPLESAVGLANELAVEGDVVLLSPACASYDMFDNYQQRGDEFTRLVRELAD